MSDLLLIASIAGERIALAASAVEAVVEIDSITAVPRSAPHVAGLAALRSRVLTVIDTRASLELEPSPAGLAREAIVIEVDGHPYALLVDRVEDVAEHGEQTLPVRTSLKKGWRRAATGMVEAGGDLMLLIDADALLAGRAAKPA
jgi:purine-binding chemotaxis protein CheW